MLQKIVIILMTDLTVCNIIKEQDATSSVFYQATTISNIIHRQKYSSTLIAVNRNNYIQTS